MNERIDRGLAWLAIVVIALVYLASASRPVLGGDNGEFASLLAQGGVAHPSGYPLYTLFLRAFSWLPSANPAHAAALATGLLGVAAVAMLRWACRAWGASGPAATLAAVLVGVSGLMWKLATHAEVFALHALLAASIIGVSGPHGIRDPRRRAFALGLLAGLGLCNNHSIVMLAPLGLWAAWRAVSTARSRTVAVAAGVGGAVLGLTPYAYTFAAARVPGEALRWGETGNLAGLLHHFLRADYGTTSLAISDAGLDPVGHVGRLFVHLGTELHWLPALASAVGMIVLLTRRPGIPAPVPPRPPTRSSEAVPLPLHRRQVRGSRSVPSTSNPLVARPVSRGAGLAYLAAFLVAGPVFIGRFNLPLDGLALVIVERFYLLPLVLLAVPLAIGIDALVGAHLRPVEVQGPAVVGVLCLAIFVSYDDVREHHRPDVEHYLYNTLSTAEPDAVILGTGDHRLYGFWYVRTVLGHRSDVVHIDPVMLAYPWYRERVEGELGATLEGIDGTTVRSDQLAAGLLADGRPVYLTNRFSDAITRQFPTYPIGTLIRVVRPGGPMPRPEALEQMNVEVAVSYTYADTAPSDPNGWSAYVQRDYTRPWVVLADTYEAMGRPEDAERCRSRHIVVPQRGP